MGLHVLEQYNETVNCFTSLLSGKHQPLFYALVDRNRNNFGNVGIVISFNATETKWR